MFNQKFFLLFVSGSGSGDQSYWCSFTTTYDVYEQNNGTLTLCGRLIETQSSDKKNFYGEIKGVLIDLPFLATEVFTKIEEMKHEND